MEVIKIMMAKKLARPRPCPQPARPKLPIAVPDQVLDLVPYKVSVPGT